MLTMSGIWPRRSVPRVRDMRVLWQTGDKLAAQLTAWLRIDGSVDGLMRDVLGWIVGPHALELTPPRSAGATTSIPAG